MRPTLKPAGEANVDVPVLIGLNPCFRLHCGLRGDGSGFHAGVDLVPSPIEKSGVDKHHSLAGATDTFGEVDGCATLLVHDAHLEGVARQIEEVFYFFKQCHGKADFIGAMHFGFDDVHGACSRILQAAGPFQVVKRAEGREQPVHETFGYLLSLSVENRRVGHEMTDVAHK